MVDFENEVLINKGLEHCHLFTWQYTISFIPPNMVKTRVWEKLRMRKQNTKATVPLDVVPERRTERFLPRVAFVR